MKNLQLCITLVKLLTKVGGKQNICSWW